MFYSIIPTTNNSLKTKNQYSRPAFLHRFFSTLTMAPRRAATLPLPFGHAPSPPHIKGDIDLVGSAQQKTLLIRE